MACNVVAVWPAFSSALMNLKSAWVHHKDFGKKYRYEAVSVECYMDPNIGKATGTERTVEACGESQSTSRGPHRMCVYPHSPDTHTHTHTHMYTHARTLVEP